MSEHEDKLDQEDQENQESQKVPQDNVEEQASEETEAGADSEEEESPVEDEPAEADEMPETVQEVAAEMSQPIAAVADLTSDFREELIAFFTEHNHKKIKFVTKILDKFRGNEEAVMEHLRKHYSNGNLPPRRNRLWGSSLGSESFAQSATEATATAEDGAPATQKTTPAKGTTSKKTGAAKPKKKKIMIIIIIGVVVIGLAVAGYLFKDQIMGMFGGGHDEPAAQEAVTTDDSGTTQEAGVVDAPEAEEAIPAADSTAVDSTATDTTVAAIDSTAAEDGSTPE